ncbi:MAG: MraY family glycosyltransferase, partial [Planctomycetota bacterium]
MVLLSLLLIPIGLLLAAPVCWVMLQLGRRTGAMDTSAMPGQQKLSTRAVPNTGGVGIFLAIAAPLAVALLGAHLIDPDAGWLPEQIRAALPGVRNESTTAIVFLLALAALHALGLLDDRRPLGPMLKLAIMLGVAAAPPLLTDTRLLTMLDPLAGGTWASFALTTLWIAVVANAFNFMDNMDGLAATTAATAGAGFLAATLLNGQWFVAGMLALVVGACVGFLLFNLPPAKMYMGDAGSLVLGYALGFLTVRTTYYIEPGFVGPTGAHPIGGGWYGVL